MPIKKSNNKLLAVTRAEYESQVEPIVSAGLAPNKAAWIEVHMAEGLSFPLNAELRALIPSYLSGAVPKSREELDSNLELISKSEYDCEIRPILNSGLMPNKAAWLEEHMTESLSFPLDAELKAHIPAFLPGETPSSESDFYANLIRLRE
jgi:hypothetical protein